MFTELEARHEVFVAQREAAERFCEETGAKSVIFGIGTDNYNAEYCAPAAVSLEDLQVFVEVLAATFPHKTVLAVYSKLPPGEEAKVEVRPPHSIWSRIWRRLTGA